MQHIFFLLSKVLDFLLSPLSWIVILLLISIITKNKKRSRKCLYWAIGALLFFSNPFALNLVMHAWEVQSVPIDSIHKQYDAVIMMGGAIRYVNGQLQRPVFGSGADRYVQSMELFYRNKAKHIIISSGSGSLVYTDVKEADLLRDQMIRIGIPADKLIAENQSRNTYENAKNTAEIIQKSDFKPPFLLVTSAFHMRRSMLCFQKQGIDVIPFAVDQHSGQIMFTPDKLLLPSPEVLLDWDLLFHEWFGIAVYKVMGYL